MRTHSTYTCSFFFFNDTATTEIYTLSLHDALPIYDRTVEPGQVDAGEVQRRVADPLVVDRPDGVRADRAVGAVAHAVLDPAPRLGGDHHQRDRQQHAEREQPPLRRPPAGEGRGDQAEPDDEQPGA